jgi:hypothetical protein
MRDLEEYLRDYRAYISATFGWRKVLISGLVWLCGMCAPLWAKVFVQLPNWVTIAWMVGWGSLGYIFAPYGMWKHHRTQVSGSHRPDRK